MEKKRNFGISAIIITRNEAERIGACLVNLKWTDEIIVIDNGSGDRTPDIARENFAKVYRSENGSFADLRNLGLAKAQMDWLLYIDADESVTPQLREEIVGLLKTDVQHSAFYLRRRNYYLGKQWPQDEYLPRLFRKNRLKGWTGEIHESPVFEGAAGYLQSPLIHRTHRSLSEMLSKTNEWSRIEAKLRYDAKHPPVVWWRFIRVMLSGFYDSYIRKRGFKAGVVGLIESIYQSFSMFVTYAKLWEMQNRKVK